MVNLNDLMEVLLRNGLLQNNGSMPQNQQGKYYASPIQGVQGQQKPWPLSRTFRRCWWWYGQRHPNAPYGGGMPPIGNGIAPMMPMGISPGKPQQATSPKVSTDDREMLKKTSYRNYHNFKRDEKKE